MPKRTTLTFTSEDGPRVDSAKLYVYHCKYSGRHAFTIDADLKKMPRRRTDGAYIVDTNEHTIKLYTTDGGLKYIKRQNGAIEKQYRQNLGQLPIAYKSDLTSPLLYILDNAVTTFSNQNARRAGKLLVPPCITRSDKTGLVEMRIELDERSHRCCLSRVTADVVRVHVTGLMAGDAVHEELFDLISKVLNVRLSQLDIRRAKHNRNRIMTVEGLTPEQVFERLREQLKKQSTAREEKRQRRHG
ncbi:hypothetical protein CHLRE_12g485750v5 [Chlamydomonas reinhardtii]|uniref:STEEP1 domain-containing protein n=1 Tax=Chlamydomonas reinhardtii TaxID=3055 RepID=A8IL05_CHLRE|nr:uncharacterized protein CHLRE_12g485750v5 [Chlamydomonas reinhardtii]PNW74719.1 hypothetical protein CHLRE_12g485750v5 [Chlamydomonas reinhardtii]|eukprot:XP_001690888.1 predicted protein [Chlamydomonas reinhardtii]